MCQSYYWGSEEHYQQAVPRKGWNEEKCMAIVPTRTKLWTEFKQTLLSNKTRTSNPTPARKRDKRDSAALTDSLVGPVRLFARQTVCDWSEISHNRLCCLVEVSPSPFLVWMPLCPSLCHKMSTSTLWNHRTTAHCKLVRGCLHLYGQTAPQIL